MAESFSDIGKVEAIDQLYRLSAYHPVPGLTYTASNSGKVHTAARMFLEGIDFNLVYFPLKHLGYKSVVGTVGELYAALAHPKLLNVILGISSKLDFDHVKELWMGITVAAKEHGFEAVNLDLQPSNNGLFISLAATGETSLLTDKRRMAAKSKDLLCISGRLGAAYLGMQVLEKYGYFVTKGLGDALKRLQRDSGLGAKVYADHIPFEGNTFQLGKQLDIDPVSAAFNGGDDFRLLFTVPILHAEKFRRDFQTFDIIGHLAQPDAGTVLVTPEGVEFPVKAQGWKDESEA